MGHLLLDLSDAQDHGLSLVLLRLSTEELLPKCALVSKQWNEILSRKAFWIDKAELDDYKLPWPILSGANLSIISYQSMAAKHPFNRNFIKDRWDLSKRDVNCYSKDTRWNFNQGVIWTHNDHDSNCSTSVRIEAPPVFLNGAAEVGPGLISDQVSACLTTSYTWFEKSIVINLAAEGLTSEIMDKLHPTFVISELVANRKDCSATYWMRSWLSSDGIIHSRRQTRHKRRSSHSSRREEDYVEGVNVSNVEFKQWEAEGWRLVEKRLKEYPAGMRYLIVQCSGSDKKGWTGFYGVKMANCLVQAICDRNAAAEESVKATDRKSVV